MMHCGKTQRVQKWYKHHTQKIQALLLLSLLALTSAQGPVLEAEPESSSSFETVSWLVSYILTYSQSISCEALADECNNLNLTSIICGIVKQLVDERSYGRHNCFSRPRPERS